MQVLSIYLPIFPLDFCVCDGPKGKHWSDVFSLHNINNKTAKVLEQVQYQMCRSTRA